MGFNEDTDQYWVSIDGVRHDKMQEAPVLEKAVAMVCRSAT